MPTWPVWVCPTLALILGSPSVMKVWGGRWHLLPSVLHPGRDLRFCARLLGCGVLTLSVGLRSSWGSRGQNSVPANVPAGAFAPGWDGGRRRVCQSAWAAVADAPARAGVLAWRPDVLHQGLSRDDSSLAGGFSLSLWCQDGRLLPSPRVTVFLLCASVS